MNEKEAFIDSIREKLISPNELFEESLLCFKNGCNRSSYIIAWISIVESLKQKISSFADLGDTNSIKAQARIEGAEKKKASTDRMITEEAINCNIIDDPQASSLNFLWEQRCLFAHPYYSKPTDDQVINILNEAIQITLGKDLNFNKAYLDELCRKIIDYPHFIPSQQGAKSYFRQTLLRVPESLQPYLFKKILMEISKIDLDQSKLNETEKLRMFLVMLFLTTTIPINDTRFQLEKGITESPFTCWIGYVHKETWHKIPRREKTMLFSYLSSETDHFKLDRLYRITQKIGNQLEPKFQLQYGKILENSSFLDVMTYYLNVDTAFERIMSELSNGWDSQNMVCAFLNGENSHSFLSELSNLRQIELGRKIRYAADRNAFTAKDYVGSIISHNKEVPGCLKAGIGIGYIIPVKDQFEIPSKSEMNKMIQTLSSVNDSERELAYKFLNTQISSCKPPRWTTFSKEEFISDSSEILAKLDEFLDQTLFSSFIKSVNTYMDN